MSEENGLKRLQKKRILWTHPFRPPCHVHALLAFDTLHQPFPVQYIVLPRSIKIMLCGNHSPLTVSELHIYMINLLAVLWWKHFFRTSLHSQQEVGQNDSRRLSKRQGGHHKMGCQRRHPASYETGEFKLIYVLDMFCLMLDGSRLAPMLTMFPSVSTFPTEIQCDKALLQRHIFIVFRLCRTIGQLVWGF